jgi:hypothetical protein
MCHNPQHRLRLVPRPGGPLSISDKTGSLRSRLIRTKPEPDISGVSRHAVLAPVEPRPSVVAVAPRRPALLVVQVWPRGPSGAPGVAHDVALAHPSPWPDRRGHQVAVAHAEVAQRPGDDDVDPVGRPPRLDGEQHPPGTGRIDEVTLAPVRRVVVAGVVASRPVAWRAVGRSDREWRDWVRQGGPGSYYGERSGLGAPGILERASIWLILAPCTMPLLSHALGTSSASAAS